MRQARALMERLSGTGRLERSAERDAALRAMLPEVPRLGWSTAALRAGLSAAGEAPDAAAWLFPRGPAGMVEAWCDLADRDMAEAAAGMALEEQRIPARIRALVALRLRQQRPHKEAVRRAMALLALPWNAAAAARATARTTDAIWQAAGDTSHDLSFYTRRATLAGVYGTTLAFWLHDADPDDAATLAFLDRRLADVARLQRRPRRPAAGAASAGKAEAAAP
ncbi:COQ9 family protein [Pseudoroseomonas cervicalis]|uniref:COQ9 family protein n=1 Tax=Teichococcus cervicalis TaxID=204525 RepID=UPI0022F19528|nr:COQ9 family protein [Pseudoroseomonas cervicalis]WBV42248.1 COQ9 family protein [Pseudoroseomonas cervicalis]